MNRQEYIKHRVLRRPYQLTLRINKGRGKPLLLLHGLAANSNVWQPLISRLDTKIWRAIAFDLLGFGYSPKPEWANYSVNQHATAVIASLKKIKVKQGVTIVAHSMGCLVAIRIAKSQPKLVSNLILYEPPLFVDLPEFRSHVRRRKRYFALYKRVASNPQLIIKYAITLGRLASRLPGSSLSKETWIPFERSLRNTIMDQTAYDDLSYLKQPVDIIHGRLDIVVTRSEIRKMFAVNPNITFHLVNESHWISPKSARYLLKLL